MSGVLGFGLLCVLAFAGLFVSFEADHDCRGSDCIVCLELQACLGTCQLVGTATPPAVDPCPPVVAAVDVPVPHACRAVVLTLHSLDVRFDE